MWLDEARQAGVVAGPDQWVRRLVGRRHGLERRLSDLEARGAAAAGGDDDDEISDKVDTVRRRLAAVRGLQTAASALVGACGEPPARASWGGWAEFFAAAVAAVFQADAADEARDAASRLQALAVLEEEVGLEEAAGMLRDLLAGSRVPLGRVGRDGVAVVTPLSCVASTSTRSCSPASPRAGSPPAGGQIPCSVTSSAGASARRSGCVCRWPSSATRSPSCCSRSLARPLVTGSCCWRRARAPRMGGRACRRGSCCGSRPPRPAGRSGWTSSSTASRCGRCGVGSPARPRSQTARSGSTSGSATSSTARARGCRTPRGGRLLRLHGARRSRCGCAPIGGLALGAQAPCPAPGRTPRRRRPSRARGHSSIRRGDAPDAPGALRELPVRLPPSRRVRPRRAR